MDKLTVSHIPAAIYLKCPRFTCGEFVGVKALNQLGFVSGEFRRVLSACPAADAARRRYDANMRYTYVLLFGGLLIAVLAIATLAIPEVGERPATREVFTFALFGGLLLFGVGNLLNRDSSEQFKRMVEIYNDDRNQAKTTES